MPTFRIDCYRAIAALAIGCAATLAMSPAVQAADADLTVAHSAASPRSAVLTNVRTAFVDGDRIGSLHGGADCSASGDREWSQLIRRRIETEMPQVFREELAKAQTSAATSGAKAAPLKVQAFLNNIHVDVCQAGAGAWQGEFYVQVGWQIVSPESGKVVYQASTEGAFSLASPQRVTSTQALRQAFGVAVRNLLADRRFVAMLGQTDQHLAFADSI